MAKINAKSRNSGVAGRKWRFKLAELADRTKPAMRTMKFPLDHAVIEWRDAEFLHQIIASDKQGSLIHLLYTTIISGFRVFGKTTLMNNFRNSDALGDDEWIEEVLQPSGLSVAEFIPSKIYDRLLVVPREIKSVGKVKDTGFRADVIAFEYEKFFCAGKSGDKLPDAERLLFKTIGQAFEKTFNSWSAVSNDETLAAQVIDDVLKELGYPKSKVSLAKRLSRIKTVTPNGTIAFDRSSPVFNVVEGIEPHMIVSRAMHVGRAEGVPEKDLGAYAKTFLTGDGNHSGLSWLFGTGLLKYLSVVSYEQAAEDFDIPKDRFDSLRALLDAARSIPPSENTFLGGSYADYRSVIGGNLTQWVTSYINRLYELQEILVADIETITLPISLLSDEKMLSDLGITAIELSSLGNRAKSDRELTIVSLNRLMGIGNETMSIQDVEVIEQYGTLLSTLSGLFASIKEKIKRATEIAKSKNDDSGLKLLADYEFDVPKWVKPLQKLNRLDLAPPNPALVLEKAATDFDLLDNEMFNHYARIQSWATSTGETLSPLVRATAKEAGYARNAKSKRNPNEQAFRLCLDMVLRAARKCSDDTVRLVRDFIAGQNVFAVTRDLNQYLFNRNGMLFKDVMNKTPRTPYAITLNSLERSDEIMAALGNFIADMRLRVMSESVLNLKQVTDLLRLERAWFAMLLVGMPENIPAKLSMPAEKDVADAFNLPVTIRLRIIGDTVSSSIMRQIFNHYYSQLEKLVAILLRDRFYLRAGFQRSGESSLIYVPNDKPWEAPERLYKTDLPIGQIMRRLHDSATGDSAIIDPPVALAYLSDNGFDMADRAVRHYMRQAPHDWMFAWPIGQEIVGLPIGKQEKTSKLSKYSACRMVGSPAYKGVLDTLLVDSDAGTIGDIKIMVDQCFDQSASRDEKGKLLVNVKPTQTHVTLCLPVKTEHKLVSDASEKNKKFENYVAIDLGERGIAYSVFNGVTHEQMEKGRLSIKSMHRLSKDDRIGKRKKSQINKFRAAFDPAEERRRENVLGDITNAINRLMWYYKAFPVLEHSAGGASTSIDKVYQWVAERYLYSSTPTVNDARVAYWVGATKWTHPTLVQFKFDKELNKKSTAVQPLNLFPGVGVSAFGTSQTCSCCGRNPMEIVRKMNTENKNAPYKMTDGKITLENGVIKINKSAPERDRLKYRQRNERVPIDTPLGLNIIAADDLVTQIKRNMRQAPVSKMSQDTSVSQFHCLYVDCGVVVHADENAAINIGKKFAVQQQQITLAK